MSIYQKYKKLNSPFYSLIFCLTTTIITTAPTYAESIQSRISPVGTVAVEGIMATPADNTATTASTTAVTATPSKELRSGETVYKQYCFVCHDTGLAGAPKAGEWQPKLDEAKAALKAEGKPTSNTEVEKYLLEVSIKGKGAMPPKGTCIDCMDDELKNAIEYMLKK